MGYRRPRALEVVSALTVLSLLFFTPHRPTFIITTSPSMPAGLYLIDYDIHLKRGDIVVFRLPPSLQREMNSRPWFQKGIRYLKTIGAIGGDAFCVTADRVTIRDKTSLPLFMEDSEGHPLPHLPTGCRTVPEHSFLPTSSYSPRSFDGRYYGPIDVRFIEGRATALLLF
jgi:conjugative transfer signal peptidase TraF